MRYSFFFFNDTATTEIYTLSLHDALPICDVVVHVDARRHQGAADLVAGPRHLEPSPHDDCSIEREVARQDRKSTRLNSSHGYISYAVFCLQKKKHLRRTVKVTSRTPPRMV